MGSRKGGRGEQRQRQGNNGGRLVAVERRQRRRSTPCRPVVRLNGTHRSLGARSSAIRSSKSAASSWNTGACRFFAFEGLTMAAIAGGEPYEVCSAAEALRHCWLPARHQRHVGAAGRADAVCEQIRGGAHCHASAAYCKKCRGTALARLPCLKTLPRHDCPCQSSQHWPVCVLRRRFHFTVDKCTSMLWKVSNGMSR